MRRIWSLDQNRRVKLLVLSKGRKGNPFDPGYEFIIFGYLSNPDDYSESLSQFDKLVQSLQIYD